MNRLHVVFAFVLAFVLNGCGCFQTAPAVQEQPASQASQPAQQSDLPLGFTVNPSDPSQGWYTLNGMSVQVERRLDAQGRVQWVPVASTPGARINDAVADRVVNRTRVASQQEVNAGTAIASGLSDFGTQASNMSELLLFAGQANDATAIYEGRRKVPAEVVAEANAGVPDALTPARRPEVRQARTNAGSGQQTGTAPIAPAAPGASGE